LVDYIINPAILRKNGLVALALVEKLSLLEQDHMQFNEILKKVHSLHDQCYHLENSSVDTKFASQIEKARQFLNDQKNNI